MIYHNLEEHFDTIDEAFEHWYGILTNHMEDNFSRDGNVVGEIINAITVIEDPTRCIMRNKIRNLPVRYCVGELLWYLSANNNLSEIQKYSKSWDRMSDDGKKVNSNYGYLMKEYYGFDQIDMVEKMLRDNSFSRQAVVHLKPVWNIEENPTKDLPCTVCLQFFIRNNKLYMTTYMRSNDLWMGFPYDVFQFTCLQVWLSMRLGVDLGTYTHITGSLHLYKRDYKEEINENKDNRI